MGEQTSERTSAERVPASSVRLRLLRLEDASALADLEDRNRSYLLTGAPAHGDDWATRAGQRAAIAQLLAQDDAGTCLPMAILLDDRPSEPGRIVGRITLNQILRGPVQWASVGYWIDEGESGRGVVTHALRQIIDVAFQGVGLHRLEASVVVGNDRSASVLRACGFQECGFAPRMLRLGIAGDGWADCRLFQLVDMREEADDPRGEVRPAEPGATDPAGVRIRAEVPALEETLALYDAVGWDAYTEDPQTLGRALAGSTRVVTARQGERLLGIARVLSDGASIAYLQDVLVDPGSRRRGIGADLVRAVLAPFAHLRQQVLLTDADSSQRAFYESLGLREAHDHDPPLRAFVHLRR